MAKTCVSCKKQAGILSGLTFESIKGRDYCSDCGVRYVREVIAPIVVTTTPSVDGYEISRYIDVESVEIVIGTGVFSEFAGGVADFFGARSTDFEKKMQAAKRTAIDRLRYAAHDRGGSAVVGVDLDYTEFSGNRIGIIANGTIVELRPIERRLG